MVGIGFFAPLPLALMMPFMAGQSMLMGDAFGKAYQYGKRRISAMTNEEFNKLTPQQLGKEIATDYSAMIPSLQVAIKQSSDFQSLIIQELATIIRSLPKDIISGFTGDSANPITTIQQETQHTPENIDYGKIAIATLKIMLGPIASNFNIPGFGKAEATNEPPPFIGPPEPLPDTLSQHIDIQTELIEENKKDTPSAKVLSAAEDPVYLAWITKLGILKAEFTQAKKQYQISSKMTDFTKKRRAQSIQWSKMFSVTSQIRSMSNDYRNSNNHIRENAVRLRRELTSGQWNRTSI